ncbi:MAG: hypothetical protein WA151_02085, partial [Desulfatirhabdiaceae bacterium]
RVQLDVQGKYHFTTWLKHAVDITWVHTEEEETWEPHGVHEIRGAYNSQTGVGHIVLEGHVPQNVQAYGDVEIRVNGVPVNIPLMSKEGFLDKLAEGGIVQHQADGLLYGIDLSTGRWEACIDGEWFKSEMAPKEGAVQVKVLVGGAPTSDQTIQLKQYTAHLNL